MSGRNPFIRGVCLFILVVVMEPRSLYAADSLGTARLHKGKIGLGIDGISGSSNILAKYFFNNQLAMQLIAGFDVDLPGGSPPPQQTKVNGITLRGGLSLLVHLSQDQVSPYVGIEGVYQYAKAGGFFSTVPDPKNSFTVSGIFGGEYYISERFTVGLKESIGAEVLLKRTVPEEDTDIALSTSTAVTARFYFN